VLLSDKVCAIVKCLGYLFDCEISS
jgi:hypothetical protein